MNYFAYVIIAENFWKLTILRCHLLDGSVSDQVGYAIQSATIGVIKFISEILVLSSPFSYTFHL